MKAELIACMGSDLTVVNAARVSFNKESDWDRSKHERFLQHGIPYDLVLVKEDKKLINYLASHNHWTPFSHCMVTLREKVPIFVARQRFKHMVGFSYNEVSRRYVDDEPEFFIPDIWRERSENKKQGSSNKRVFEVTFSNPQIGQPIEEAYEDLYTFCLETYLSMIKSGVAPEQARMVLPQSMYTEYYVTGSLAAWARAYNLRSDEHAQKEIRDLAQQWKEIIEPLFPVSWEALTNDESSVS